MCSSDERKLKSVTVADIGQGVVLAEIWEEDLKPVTVKEAVNIYTKMELGLW